MSYWETRFSQLEASQHKTAEECLKNIDKQFRTATSELESKIDTWYGRFADNNGITMTEARKWLKADELEEFHWTVDDYISYGQQNALSGEWMKQLENASAKTHIRRYEALETEMQESIEKLYNGEYYAINDTMREIYENGFYHSAFEIEKGTHVGTSLARLDERTISKVINTPWAVDGKNFSERIWDDKEKLINTLDQELVQNIILGEDPQKAIDAIAKAMGTSRNNAGRLVMTEEAYFSSVAQQDAFEELGVEEYEIVATLDSKTSEICAGLDGQHFPMKDYEAGVSAPPFHPNCRTTTCPYFEDNYGSVGERAMRVGDENSTEYISADTTYDNWAEKYLQSENGNGIIKDEDGNEISNLRVDLQNSGITYNEVGMNETTLTEEQIVEKIGGGDLTAGSCSSEALAYMANKNGMDVTDYRGGSSQHFFARNGNIQQVGKLEGINGQTINVKNEQEAANSFLNGLKADGKEYYMAVGKHAAIVRKNTEGVTQYLELQSAISNGWKDFSDKTLKWRFGATKSHTIYGKKYETPMTTIEVSSVKGNTEYQKIMGYINTSAGAQKKGSKGSAK